MEQVDFTPPQQIIIDSFKDDPFLVEKFYFTGGTALSVFYLRHRESEDLDFFSGKKFDPNDVTVRMERWGKHKGFNFETQFVADVVIYNLKFKNGEKLKVDFAHYPYRRIQESPLKGGIRVDSFTDIAVNKLLTVNRRKEVKDYVDLYFILNLKPPKLSLWDLMLGVEQKFGFELDPVMVAADFMKVEEFDFLPRMTKPLKVDELQGFFRRQARELAKKFVA
jgi:predicted nucleotidyltransferase component of viral defense system